MKSYLISTIFLCFVAVWIAGCGGQPAAALSPTELKYRLIDNFADTGASVFYCGPPVITAGWEEAEALEWFSGVEKDSEEYQTILQHRNLAGIANLSTEQKLLLYQHKEQLNVVNLEPNGKTYKFQSYIQDQAGIFNIEGQITPQGGITISKKEPYQPLCPQCLTGETHIDTPAGQVAVKELRPGMAVWTSDASGVRIPTVIVKTTRVPAPPGHQLVRLLLDDGRELLASPGHPTADGRRLGDLLPGDRVDGAHVVSAERILYNEPATYDILPAGETGFYWAEGILIGSTLASSSPAGK